MTDAPERIWLSRAWASTFTAETVHHEVVIPYIAATKVQELIRDAVAAETERCAAAIPNGWAGQPHCSNMDYGPNVAAKAIAAIRGPKP